MPERRLREVLEELHNELERSDAIDTETRDLLRTARGDIEEALADSPAATPKAAAARSRIGQAIDRFEDDHPETVQLLQRVLQALSDVGI